MVRRLGISPRVMVASAAGNPVVITHPAAAAIKAPCGLLPHFASQKRSGSASNGGPFTSLLTFALFCPFVGGRA